MITNKNILILTGLAFAFVSVTLEILLFVDFAQTQLDKALAGMTAGALVVCQFAFVGLAQKQWQTNKPFAVLIALTLIALFAISTTGTASFFESRFSNDFVSQTQNSTAYKLKIENINDLKTQKQMILDTAKTAKANGNNWYSGEQLKKANAINTQIENATQNLENTQIDKSTAGNTLGRALDGKRWVVWFVIAVIIDLCPLICFASIAGSSKNAKRKHEFKDFEKDIVNSIANANDIPAKELTNPKPVGQPSGCQKEPYSAQRLAIKSIIENDTLKGDLRETQTENVDWEKARAENKNMQAFMKSKLPPIKERITQYLKDNKLNQKEFCQLHNIKDKQLSLVKNHEQRTAQNKETAPKAVYDKIAFIVTHSSNLQENKND